VTEQAKAPLEHYERAQELLAEADDREARDRHFPGWFEMRVQLAHLHLRAAEVGARLSPTVAQVAASMTSAKAVRLEPSPDAQPLLSAWYELLRQCEHVEGMFGPESSDLRQLPTEEIRETARKWGVSE
jgi:hypothetical protein